MKENYLALAQSVLSEASVSKSLSNHCLWPGHDLVHLNKLECQLALRLYEAGFKAESIEQVLIARRRERKAHRRVR